MVEIEDTFSGFTVICRHKESQYGFIFDRYHVISEEGEWVDRQWRGNRRLRSLTFARLASLNGGFDFPNNADLVPTPIAVEGKPCIAAYLREIHGLQNDEIAEKIGVSKATAKQYVSDYRHSRR